MSDRPNVVYFHVDNLGYELLPSQAAPEFAGKSRIGPHGMR